MSDRVQCFMVIPSDRARSSLRRYVSGSKCSGPFGYHNADVAIEDVDFATAMGKHGHSARGLNGYGADDFDHADARWPAACPCGYVFQAEDDWQHNVERLYRREDGTSSESWVVRKLPPGAMWDAEWYIDSFEYKGPDDRCLAVMLPDGNEWIIDSEARGGGRWTRTGAPPLITANPSILTAKYHGYLRAGFLESC